MCSRLESIHLSCCLAHDPADPKLALHLFVRKVLGHRSETGTTSRTADIRIYHKPQLRVPEDVPRIFGFFIILVKKLQPFIFDDLPTRPQGSLAVEDAMLSFFNITARLISSFRVSR